MMKLVFPLALSVVLVIPCLADPGSRTTRVYRPLEAKQVSIATGARVVPDRSDAKTFEDFKRIGWSHFDKREWDQATDAFLSALEKDPESVEIAEALAMSLYRSGDYVSAYRLGKELKRIMPSVSRHISETVQASVRFMVRNGEMEAAVEFLSRFPASDPAYAEAHGFLSDASLIAAAVEAGGEPAHGKHESLVRN